MSAKVLHTIDAILSRCDAPRKPAMSSAMDMTSNNALRNQAQNQFPVNWPIGNAYQGRRNDSNYRQKLGLCF